MHLYKITPEQYSQLLEAQGGVCAICGRPPEERKRLAVDHCHSTHVVRALLCTACNLTVGRYERYHEAVAAYLAAYGSGNPLLKP
ncbi:endonuclease VII domain-containing protein [Streptomyces coeruleorubidus]|uniref:endonuclease VII domain-containing protein n=1 Tax=Streptomyces coeruleorubidus TaxID=116188 RepID=UPI0038294668